MMPGLLGMAEEGWLVGCIGRRLEVAGGGRLIIAADRKEPLPTRRPRAMGT